MTDNLEDAKRVEELEAQVAELTSKVEELKGRLDYLVYSLDQGARSHPVRYR